MCALFSALLALLFAWPAAAGAPCVQGAMAPVDVVGHGPVANLADPLEARAPALYEEARAYTGAETCDPIRVHLVADIGAAQSLLPAWHLPPWAAGAARPSERLIVLTVHADGRRHERERVLLHELGHLAVATAAGGRPVPRWFDEGVARRLAGEDGQDDDRVLAEARLSGRLIPLEGLEASFPASKEAASVAYAVAGRALEILEAREGRGVVRRVLDEVERGVPFDEALFEVAGLWPWQLSGEVKRSVELWHAWLTLLKDVDLALGAGALLLIFGGLQARRRMRARMRAMDDDPAEKAAPFQVAIVRWTSTPAGGLSHNPRP